MKSSYYLNLLRKQKALMKESNARICCEEIGRGTWEEQRRSGNSHRIIKIKSIS